MQVCTEQEQIFHVSVANTISKLQAGMSVTWAICHAARITENVPNAEKKYGTKKSTRDLKNSSHAHKANAIVIFRPN
jgi:hypothetical protein